MHAQLRNAGQQGVGAMAVSAVDIALHDLRARLLDVPLAVDLGAVRSGVPIYGSGGFTGYSADELTEQLAGWVAHGIARVKIKVGRHPDEDEARLSTARAAIGADVELMVDANGAFSTDQALGWLSRYRGHDVRWFEEPVTQDDPAGLRRVRDAAPTQLSIASGEYRWSHRETVALLDAVDVIQADVTRCCGPTELRRIDELCASAGRPLSLHCAPAVSAHVGPMLEAAAALLAHERHAAALDARKPRVSVTGVVAGDEDRVRALVEGLVLQANSSLVDDDELYGRSSAEDGETEEEVDAEDRGTPSPDRELAARFQAFADCDEPDADA